MSYSLHEGLGKQLQPTLPSITVMYLTNINGRGASKLRNSFVAAALATDTVTVTFRRDNEIEPGGRSIRGRHDRKRLAVGTGIHQPGIATDRLGQGANHAVDT